MGRWVLKKEAVMASAREIKVGNYCTRVYTELSGMKSRLQGFVDEIESMTGPDREMLLTHIPHFQDVIRNIDWKLEILTKVCPHDWTGYKDVETVASVKLEAEPLGKDAVSGGYLGG
jgi:hypothetical protein